MLRRAGLGFFLCFFMASVAFAPLAMANSAQPQRIAQYKASNVKSFNANKHSIADTDFAKFTPKRKTSNARLNYDIWDTALQNVVLNLGISTRRRAFRPNSELGTRRLKGHKSAYRLEGARVIFSRLNDEYKQGLTAYRQDLERIANQVDITRLDRKEQLAFWFNLHNVTIIEQIAHNYPVRRPKELKVGRDKKPLHDAKLLKIRGVDISLRDIREKIVYPNWNDPKVIYGFFRGDIGSPRLPNYAFTSNNLDYVLGYNASEFVNSLRGFHEGLRALKISSIYEEARPFYFKNWPEDLRAHLRKYADEKVSKELDSDKPFKVDRYDQIVADLLAGDTPSTANLNLLSSNGRKAGRFSPEVARLLREVEQKHQILRKRGMLKRGRGIVTIEDIPTIDVDIPDTDNSSAESGE